jgi:phosphoglycolate phosphatase
MISLSDVKTIFFDYDGTLHNSIFIYAPAFQKAYDYLVENGFAEKKNWSNKEISYWLGFNPLDMWRTFMPNLREDIRLRCSDIIAEEMKHQIIHGNPVLYEGSLETLDYLKRKGYCLVFISNCKVYYKDCQNKLFGLDKYFDTFICSEQYDFIPKYEILKAIKHNYQEQMIIVGDRIHDIEAGIKNDIPAIGCSYGFALSGELQEADLIINDIKELRNYL